MTVISSLSLSRLLGEAAASPGREVCGLLFGSDARIEAAVAAPNVAARDDVMFEIDPAYIVRAQRAERAGARRMIGCYHSHPSGTALPSGQDAAAAEPGRLWLILAGGEARLWRAGADGFVEVPLTVE